MKYIFKHLSLVWILLIPALASAHEGHGLLGVEHYHPLLELEVLVALVVVLLAAGLKWIFSSRK